MDAFNSWLTSALETSDLQWLKDTDAADVLGKRWVMEIDIYWLNNKIQINPILKNSSAIKIYVSEVEWRLKEPHIGGYVSAKNRTWGSSLQSMQELCLGLYLTASALPLCQTLLLDSFDQFCLLTLCCSAREVLVIPPPPPPKFQTGASLSSDTNHSRVFILFKWARAPPSAHLVLVCVGGGVGGVPNINRGKDL